MRDLFAGRRYRFLEAIWSAIFAAFCVWAAAIPSVVGRIASLLLAAMSISITLAAVRDLVRPRPVLRLGPEGFSTPKSGHVKWTSVRGIGMSRVAGVRSLVVALNKPSQPGYVPKIFRRLPRDVVWVPISGLNVRPRDLCVSLQHQAERATGEHVPINRQAVDEADIPKLRVIWAWRRGGPKAAVHELLSWESEGWNAWPGHGRQVTFGLVGMGLGMALLASLPGGLERNDGALLPVLLVAGAASTLGPSALYTYALKEPWRDYLPAAPHWPSCRCEGAPDPALR